ncbi:low affinity immunoglobulin gamma Fc region receptor II-like [Siniperca chuatsi]|uniref:low affinity immunoglobulin gamma Fc region receptor II-like n=1 Tax=Siniperca chuatsi TaxID=119488 RepID=UPI001CE04F04|nr:low affinity immunoglobulin gamma Fc region receptor II-like [Siniperca chuatsi]
MEVTALCIRLLMNVLFLLCARAQKLDSVSLRVVPDRLQFFEYDQVTLICEGFSVSTEWKTVHNFTVEVPSCRATSAVTSKSSCTISNVYPDESGEYWCETGEGKRSNSINITVTAGSVILESPVLPVMDEEAVTLRCRNKMASNLSADFFKDGYLIRSSSTGEMTIHNVSKSDEGFYKCNISGDGESPESWLAVRGPNKTTASYPTPWIIVTVLMLVLLLVVGLLHLNKGYWHRVVLYLSTLTPGSGSAEDQTASAVYRAADADKAMYAVVTKSRKKKAEGHNLSPSDEDELSSRPLYYTVGPVDSLTQLAESRVSSIAAMSVPSAGTNPPLTEDSFYSIIQKVAE